MKFWVCPIRNGVVQPAILKIKTDRETIENYIKKDNEERKKFIKKVFRKYKKEKFLKKYNLFSVGFNFKKRQKKGGLRSCLQGFPYLYFN